MCWTRGKDWNDRNQMIKFFDREDYQLGWNKRIEIIYNNEKNFLLIIHIFLYEK